MTILRKPFADTSLGGFIGRKRTSRGPALSAGLMALAVAAGGGLGVAALPAPAMAQDVAEETRGAEEIQAAFDAFLASFRDEALAAGISARTYDTALDGASYVPRVMELNSSQPEFVRPVWDYLDGAVSDARVARGREMLARHGDVLSRMEARYGVPKQYLTAIWGLETNYGSIMGGFNVFEALATLAFEGRRQRFGREQLLAALRIVEEGHKDADRMTGSWAGAMGHTQFIPTTFLEYAVDGDGDGRRDLWDSLDDVFASTASYLANAEWRKGERWGREVLLPPGFDHGLTGMDEARPLSDWHERGIRMADGALIPALPDMEGAIILPAGANGPAFMVYPNFRTIMRYNNSTAYALAIGHLADRIVGGGGIAGDWPRDDRPLTRSEREDLQGLLNDLGHDAGPVDGILGAQTRQAIRAFQRANGLPPDGYASAELLDRLRAAAGS